MPIDRKVEENLDFEHLFTGEKKKEIAQGAMDDFHKLERRRKIITRILFWIFFFVPILIIILIYLVGK